MKLWYYRVVLGCIHLGHRFLCTSYQGLYFVTFFLNIYPNPFSQYPLVSNESLIQYSLSKTNTQCSSLYYATMIHHSHPKDNTAYFPS